PVVAPLAGSVDRNTLPARIGDQHMKSLPSRGAWIEMPTWRSFGAWRWPSLPSRGAWIEIASPPLLSAQRQVAPLAGSVDRNPCFELSTLWTTPVAPLAGSVDRNAAVQSREKEK